MPVPRIVLIVADIVTLCGPPVSVNVKLPSPPCALFVTTTEPLAASLKAQEPLVVPIGMATVTVALVPLVPGEQLALSSTKLDGTISVIAYVPGATVNVVAPAPVVTFPLVLMVNVAGSPLPVPPFVLNVKVPLPP